MARQADDLARRQQEFEGQMRRAFGPQGAGMERGQAEQMAQQKEGELAISSAWSSKCRMRRAT
jgi:hypothetical protein